MKKHMFYKDIDLKHPQFCKKPLITVIACVLAICAGCVAAAPEPNIHPLQQCARISDNHQRLLCFDRLSRSEPGGNKDNKNTFIQPQKAFTGAQLRVTENKDEFTLTVGSFLKLLKNARHEGKKMIHIKGWTQHDNEYVLHINYRHPMQLHFNFHQDQKGKSFAVLQNIDDRQRTIDASQFIYIVATMNP